VTPSIWPKDSRSAVLVALATICATQIPTTIQEIRDPFVRSCVLLLALAVALWDRCEASTSRERNDVKWRRRNTAGSVRRWASRSSSCSRPARRRASSATASPNRSPRNRRQSRRKNREVDGTRASCPQIGQRPQLLTTAVGSTRIVVRSSRFTSELESLMTEKVCVRCARAASNEAPARVDFLRGQRSIPPRRNAARFSYHNTSTTLIRSIWPHEWSHETLRGGEAQARSSRLAAALLSKRSRRETGGGRAARAERARRLTQPLIGGLRGRGRTPEAHRLDGERAGVDARASSRARHARSTSQARRVPALRLDATAWTQRTVSTVREGAGAGCR